MPIGERRRRHIRVPVTEAEAECIERKAASAGLGLAAYLRDVGMEYAPRSAVDREQVKQLMKAMADLGRMGGLLKLWLSDDEKLAAYPAHRRPLIPETLQDIRANQAQLLTLIKKLKE